jgi:hypothetical protein
MVLEMYCRSIKTIYVIHDPSEWETAVEEERRIREMINERNLDIDVMRLNTGVEWDSRRAEEIINDEDCISYTDFLSEILNE